MNKRRTALKAVNWDGDTRENTPNAPNVSIPAFTPPPPPSTSRTLSLDDDSEIDSDCPQIERKGVKVSASEITCLKYDSTLTDFNNWLQDLKSAFKLDPSKFPDNEMKVAFASVALDSQLKTTYNSTLATYPAISTY